MLPQSWPALTAYSLYSFECCVRAASVLGLVGAGGIGYEIGVSMRLFEYGQVLTLILAFVALMAFTDGVSRLIRWRITRRAGKRWQGSGGTDAVSPTVLQPSLPGMGDWRRFLIPIVILIGLSAAFYFSGFTPDVLDQENLVRHAVRFISGMVPPNVQANFIYKMGYLVLQTFAISFIGTLIGVLFGALLALPATASLAFLNVDTTGRHGIIERSVRFLIYWFARLILNVLRAIPDMVWVLVCI